MSKSIKDFEKKQKDSLMKTIWDNLRVWLEELAHTFWFWKKSNKQKLRHDQISIDMEKQENVVIEERKHTGDS